MTDVHALLAEIEAGLAEGCTPGPMGPDRWRVLLAHIRTLQQAVDEAREVIRPITLQVSAYSTAAQAHRHRASIWLSVHGSTRDG